ncbi:MAG: hypothetical protein Q9191_007180 [Dirinaria sp. TL-2023a]
MDLTRSQYAWFNLKTKRIATVFTSFCQQITSSGKSSTQTYPQTPVDKGGVRKLDLVVDNVWEWVETCIHRSPVQPVANLGLGFNQENPPQFLVDAYTEALKDVSCNQYGPTDGLACFRETLASIYSPIYGKKLDPLTEISVHSGGTEAILSAIYAFVEPGDEVIVMEPAFDLYELHIRSVGGVVKPVRLHPPANAAISVTSADEWRLDTKEVEAAISTKTKILVLNTPQNPLGKIFSRDELFSLGQLCIKYGLIILSDEVYERLHFTSTFNRIATLNEEVAKHTITVGSIGKAFNATGWRVGYAIGDRNLITQLKRAHIILSYTTAGPPQMAAAIGLEQAERNDFWEHNRDIMKAKIRILCEAFDYLGLPVSFSSFHRDFVFLISGAVRETLRRSLHSRQCWQNSDSA